MNGRNIQLQTWLGDGVLLLERATLHDELGRPFAYHLDLLSKRNDISVAEAVWSSMTISLALPNGATRYFNGVVTRFAKGEFQGDYTRYRATLRPWLWALSRVSDCRIFQNRSVPQIVKQVCGDLGFDDFDVRLSAAYGAREYLVQYRETSLDFLNRLMEQEGITYWFTHHRDRHVMVLADSHGGHLPFPGYKRITYIPPETTASGLRGEVEHIGRWEVARQAEPTTYTANDFNFESPRATLLTSLPADTAGEQGSAALEMYDYPGLFRAGDQGETAVKVAMEERRAQVERVTGAGNARGLAAGSLFTLTDYPAEDQNTEVLVVSTACHLTPNLFASGAEADGPEFRCDYVAVDSQRPIRTPRLTPRPIVQGPQTAIVVGEEGEEITTDKYGRVRIQFHWDRAGVWNQDSSCWVRVAQMWAGSGWGALHIPRIGQEVIVEFLEGDPDRPIITGRVYNGDNMPPYALPANKTQSGIKSRSTKGAGPSNFNEIRFEDKKGSEELHIQAEKDFTARVKNDRSAEVGARDSLAVGGDRAVEIKGNHLLHAAKKIDMTGDEQIRLGCGDSFILIAKDQIRIHCGSQAYVLVNDGVTAQSASSAMVVVDKNRNITLDGDKVQVAGATQTSLTGGAGSVKADAGGVVVEGPQINLNG
jgi:type VI secretion system secreted protein VgrG